MHGAKPSGSTLAIWSCSCWSTEEPTLVSGELSFLEGNVPNQFPENLMPMFPTFNEFTEESRNNVLSCSSSISEINDVSGILLTFRGFCVGECT